jgi:hypothetical protein
MNVLPTDTLFLKRCNTAWLLCGQPSSYHAMPTAAIHSLRELRQHVIWPLLYLTISLKSHWYSVYAFSVYYDDGKEVSIVGSKGQQAAYLNSHHLFLCFAWSTSSYTASVQYTSDRDNTSLNQQLHRFPNICGEPNAYITFHTTYKKKSLHVNRQGAWFCLNETPGIKKWLWIYHDDHLALASSKILCHPSPSVGSSSEL